MARRRARAPYLSGVAVLLGAAGALAASAAGQLRIPETVPGPAAAERPPPGPPEGAPPRGVPEESARTPRPGALLTEAQARLAAGVAGPAREVDEWAVRLASNPRASEAALARFSAYRALIEERLRRQGLPLDLAFVPWVESSWRNHATSSAGAAGVWQLMPATARAYGLEVSEFVDERRDPVRSTDGAARHLRDLYQATRDWHAALAAYNAGLGRVAPVQVDLWRRRGELPAETRAYVPRVLAAARVGRAPSGWGLAPRSEPPLRFREVWVDGGTPLAALAARVGTSPETLADLNPHLIRRATPPGRRWPVRVPAHAPPSAHPHP